MSRQCPGSVCMFTSPWDSVYLMPLGRLRCFGAALQDGTCRAAVELVQGSHVPWGRPRPPSTSKIRAPGPTGSVPGRWHECATGDFARSELSTVPVRPSIRLPDAWSGTSGKLPVVSSPCWRPRESAFTGESSFYSFEREALKRTLITLVAFASNLENSWSVTDGHRSFLRTSSVISLFS
ncbi:unnamed protein product [Ixodes pacificus]